jgi:hypothetical protein
MFYDTTFFVGIVVNSQNKNLLESDIFVVPPCMRNRPFPCPCLHEKAIFLTRASHTCNPVHWTVKIATNFPDKIGRPTASACLIMKTSVDVKVIRQEQQCS